MSFTSRPVLAPVVIACACVACFAGTSRAFTLQRLAAAIDVSGVAAAGRAATLPAIQAAATANVPAGITIPPTVELTGPSTELRIGFPTECDVTIEVADEAGAPLFLAQAHMPAGWQKVGFSGHDAQGHLLPNGVYYYTVTADGYSRTSRVTITR